MQAKEVMSKEVVTIKRSTTLKELLEKFANFHLFPLVPVTEENGRLVGLVSFRNLVNVFQSYQPELMRGVPFLDEEQENIFKVELTEVLGSLVVAEDIMERKFITIQEDTPLEEVYKLMKLHLKEELPVVNRAGKLVGMIGIFDILRQVFHEKGIIK